MRVRMVDGSLYVCPDCSHEFDSVEEVDCKIEGSTIVLKTCFLKK